MTDLAWSVGNHPIETALAVTAAVVLILLCALLAGQVDDEASPD